LAKSKQKVFSFSEIKDFFVFSAKKVAKIFVSSKKVLTFASAFAQKLGQ